MINLQELYPITYYFLDLCEQQKTVEEYKQEFPQDSFYLPSFLKARGYQKFICELADTENCIYQLEGQENDIPKTLSKMKPGDVQINPYCHILQLDYDILSFIQNFAREDKPRKPQELRNLLFLSKDPKNTLNFYKGCEISARMLDLLKETEQNAMSLKMCIKKQLQREDADMAVARVFDRLNRHWVLLTK